MESLNDTKGKGLPIPFVLDLPNSYDKHFHILNQTRNLKLYSGLVCLAPGQDVGSHTTGEYEEMLVILEGEGELEASGIGRQKIAIGQVAYNPPQTNHNVFNTGTNNLRYIYIVVKVN